MKGKNIGVHAAQGYVMSAGFGGGRAGDEPTKVAALVVATISGLYDKDKHKVRDYSQVSKNISAPVITFTQDGETTIYSGDKVVKCE